ncbi:hypothetical protein RI103_06075 [Paraburkholderia sp. FT54]|uniref:hypothetical protein n=1 Tax=Paraburkholderia sp. FT54 TaxID=3074437 RepID=UPI00287742F2|nr:hypothetical protein [Paraburkholderia sp. FT54]WNC90914.1 hypothetical protein RI103_06075 [Paraburkholderia sp. FT54]
MKERPILFSGPMVRALLDGSKTQTRRVVKLPHNNRLGVWEPTTFGGPNDGHTAEGDTVPLQGAIWHTRTGDSLMCPHGQPGDRLYVRETHEVNRIGFEEGPNTPARHYAGVKYQADDGRAEFSISQALYRNLDSKESRGWTPSIHMPRWASRITLEVTGVRVERLHDITDADALAEGVDRTNTSIPGYARERFVRLWTSINGNESWTADPWVWVVEFKRVT